MKILFIGDVYGRVGIDTLLNNLESLKDKYRPDIIICNGENANNGRGISKSIYEELVNAGINYITMGNHTWTTDELKDFIEGSNIIRPINDNIELGSYYKIAEVGGRKILITNILGSVYIKPEVKNGFIKLKELLTTAEFDYSFIDIHAEATSEKVALAHYLDGLASLIVGTHTHVQTNDLRILPKGTIYLTDVGMTGPLNGVIGVDKDIVINRFINV